MLSFPGLQRGHFIGQIHLRRRGMNLEVADIGEPTAAAELLKEGGGRKKRKVLVCVRFIFLSPLTSPDSHASGNEANNLSSFFLEKKFPNA